MSKKEVVCSFCGRDKRDTELIVTGISGYICDRCISDAYQILKDEVMMKKGSLSYSKLRLYKPVEIKII